MHQTQFSEKIPLRRVFPNPVTYVHVPTVSLLGDGVWERDYLCGDVLSYLGEFSKKD